MLFYVLKRLGLLGSTEKGGGCSQHIVAINKTAVQSAVDQPNYLKSVAPALSGIDQ